MVSTSVRLQVSSTAIQVATLFHLGTGVDTGRVMSQENLELLRCFIEAFNRGDLEAAIALADPPREFESVPSVDFPPDLADVQRGPEVHELIDAGRQVVVSATFRGRGKQSGAEASREGVWGVWAVRDGSLVRFQGFTDRDAALEAAGLRE
jgi:hypothetical protein